MAFYFWVDSFKMFTTKCERSIREVVMMTYDDCYAGRKENTCQMKPQQNYLMIVLNSFFFRQREKKPN